MSKIDANNPEFKAAIKEYLSENLRVRVDVGFDYGYHGRRIEVELVLGGEVIAVASDKMPE